MKLIMLDAPNFINFNKPQKYKLVKQLGEGACGRTVQVRDEDIDSDFVIKKYSPIVSNKSHPEVYVDFLERFKAEAKILFKINHPNIVRIFNFFDYRDQETSYIVMEMISGTNILEYASSQPNQLAELFEQVIAGFSHLEAKKILHRDIRPDNILVSKTGEAKIIDFGFGKDLSLTSYALDKSISLNWWCTVPLDFDEGLYDFQTEIYFVGKLFEAAIRENVLTDFKYNTIVSEMCCRTRSGRSASFVEIQNRISKGQFQEIDFDDDEIEIYRDFSSNLTSIIVSLDPACDYNRDTSEILRGLEKLYISTMLEEAVNDPVKLVEVFLDGGFRYMNGSWVPVTVVNDFIQLLKRLSNEKSTIVISNLLSRFDAISRTSYPRDLDDEIPF